jgi:hypothetical protein
MNGAVSMKRREIKNMPTFRFEGHDRFAKPMRGHVDAKDEAEACAQLRAKNIYAMKVELDGPEEMSTVLRHEPELELGVTKKATASIFTKKPSVEQDEIESELFVDRQPEMVLPTAPAASADKTAAPADWENALKLRLESISMVLRRMNEWKKSPETGPAIGGKTWELFEANLNELSKNLMSEAIKSAVDMIVTRQLGIDNSYPQSRTFTGGGYNASWSPGDPGS